MTHTLRSALAAILLSCAVVPARADNVDDYLTAEMAKHHIPGLSVAVIREGKILKAQGYGLANVEFCIPVTKDTVHQLASATKIFTGTSIMMLIEEGKISLDDKPAKFLPDLPNAWGSVTVRHLLSHTSGLPDVSKVSQTSTMLPSPDQQFTRQEVLEKLSTLPGSRLQVDGACPCRFAVLLCLLRDSD